MFGQQKARNMPKLLYFLLIVALMGCNAQKRAIKRLAKIHREHPELFAAKADTTTAVRQVLVDVPGSRADSLFLPIADTFLLETVKVRTEIRIVRDTLTREITNYVVSSECLPETIEIEITDTLVVVKESMVTKTIEVPTTPTWAWAMAGFLAFLIIIIVVVTIKNIIS